MGIDDVKRAIGRLTADEVRELSRWFDEFLSRKWDEQIELDARAGRLAPLIQQAREHHEAGRTRPL